MRLSRCCKKGDGGTPRGAEPRALKMSRRKVSLAQETRLCRIAVVIKLFVSQSVVNVQCSVFGVRWSVVCVQCTMFCEACCVSPVLSMLTRFVLFVILLYYCANLAPIEPFSRDRDCVSNAVNLNIPQWLSKVKCVRWNFRIYYRISCIISQQHSAARGDAPSRRSGTDRKNAQKSPRGRVRIRRYRFSAVTLFPIQTLREYRSYSRSCFDSSFLHRYRGKPPDLTRAKAPYPRRARRRKGSGSAR